VRGSRSADAGLPFTTMETWIIDQPPLFYVCPDSPIGRME
jgi:hypothetical protein